MGQSWRATTSCCSSRRLSSVGSRSRAGTGTARRPTTEALALDEQLRALWSPHPSFHLVPHNPSFLRKITVGLAVLESVVATNPSRDVRPDDRCPDQRCGRDRDLGGGPARSEQSEQDEEEKQRAARERHPLHHQRVAVGTGLEAVHARGDEQTEAAEVDRVPQPARQAAHQPRRDLHGNEQVGGDDAPRDGAWSEGRRHRDEQLAPAEHRVAVGPQGHEVDRDEHQREGAEEAVQVEEPGGDPALADQASRDASPHKMLAVTSAHATTPDDARRVPGHLRVHRGEHVIASSGTSTTVRSSRNSVAVTPVPWNNVGAAVVPSTIAALASPSAHHASGPCATTATTPASVGIPSSGSMMWCSSCPPRLQRRSREVLVTTASVSRTTSRHTCRRVEGVEHGDAPSAVGHHACQRGRRRPSRAAPRTRRGAAGPRPRGRRPGPCRCHRGRARCREPVVPRRSSSSSSTAPKPGAGSGGQTMASSRGATALKVRS